MSSYYGGGGGPGGGGGRGGGPGAGGAPYGRGRGGGYGGAVPPPQVGVGYLPPQGPPAGMGMMRERVPGPGYGGNFDDMGGAGDYGMGPRGAQMPMGGGRMPIPAAAGPPAVRPQGPPGTGMGMPAGPPQGGPPVRYANDCEIVVTAKAQQNYAEMIEKAVKEMKLKVDIMFPKQDVKLGAFIENIASLGTIFAIVIRPDNEAHRSVSVHVLRGAPKPEEHRNMPLAAAYQLIKERYVELKRREVGMIPENMKTCMRHLLDDQTLSDSQYAMLIKFLQDRRRKVKAFENRTNNVVTTDENDLLNNPDAEELKQRILGILSARAEDPDGERIGDLLIPKPKETLPDASAIGNLVNKAEPTSIRGIGRGGGGPNYR